MLKKRFVVERCAVLALLAGLAAALLSALPAGAATMQDLFWKRAWKEMEALYASMDERSPQDAALMANAYRIQDRWPDAVAILEEYAGKFPASIKPYADMTLLLGYERANRDQEALALAEKLWKNAPQELKYYVAYAQYRLLAKGADERKIGEALSRMLAAAETKERRIYALSNRIKLSGNRAESALKLLELQPSNKEAAQVLLQQPKPWSNAVRVALGVYAHLAGENAAAEERLRPVPMTGTGGRKAAYYRAWSLYRLKRSGEALDLWSRLALSGNAYAEPSVRRIATLAGKAGKVEKKAAMDVLERVIKERRGKPQARALLALCDLLDKSQAKYRDALEAKVLSAYPDTPYAFNVLWGRGWKNVAAGNLTEAVRLWRQADAPNIGPMRRARLLYWIADAERRSGNKAGAGRTQALLERRYPLSIYALLSGGEKLKIVDGEDPALATKPSELEQWGFVLYAKLRLSRPKAGVRELYRALRLSRWLGLEESYNEARRLETLLTSGRTLYRANLEALYPRPFRAQVKAACEAYSVEDALVWAVMRQESSFRPDARSHAGATGLMQLMPGTAKGEAKRAGLEKYDLLDVNDNIRLGTSHLAWLGRSFPRVEWVMAAYNAGSGNARKWLKNGGEGLPLDRWIEAVKFDETCGYVQRVSANLRIYRMLYGTAGAR